MTVIPAVLTWQPATLRRWLVQPGRPKPTFVVVNGIPAAFPEISHDDHWFFTGANYYFTGGWNRGIAAILARHPEIAYIWMCDDGTTGCTVAVLNTLLRDMEAHPDLAMASPVVPGSPHAHMVPRSGGQFRYVRYLDHPAALLSVRAWREVGPFDERFASYGNTEDWTLRARKAGYRFGVDDAVTVEHQVVGDHGGVSWIDAFERKWGTRDLWDSEGKIVPWDEESLR